MEWVRETKLYYEAAIEEWAETGAIHYDGKSTLDNFMKAVRIRCGKEWQERLRPFIKRFYFEAKENGVVPTYHMLTRDAAEEKQRLTAKYGALGVDAELATLAKPAERGLWTRRAQSEWLDSALDDSTFEVLRDDVHRSHSVPPSRPASSSAACLSTPQSVSGGGRAARGGGRGGRGSGAGSAPARGGGGPGGSRGSRRGGGRGGRGGRGEHASTGIGTADDLAVHRPLSTPCVTSSHVRI